MLSLWRKGKKERKEERKTPSPLYHGIQCHLTMKSYQPSALFTKYTSFVKYSRHDFRSQGNVQGGWFAKLFTTILLLNGLQHEEDSLETTLYELLCWSISSLEEEFTQNVCFWFDTCSAVLKYLSLRNICMNVNGDKLQMHLPPISIICSWPKLQSTKKCTDWVIEPPPTIRLILGILTWVSTNFNDN